MIEDLKILETVERYISGQMSPDERMYFEQLRKTNPEIDQAVVEHTFFMQQLNRFDDARNLRTTLNDTHIHLAEKGLIKSSRLKGQAKLVYLYNRYKRVSMIAASIAGITALAISALVSSLSSPRQKSEIDQISREIKAIKEKSQRQDNEIEKVKSTSKGTVVLPGITYKKGGTGFMIDARGYIVTAAHVIANARHIAVQTGNEDDMSAIVVYSDDRRDIAILKITGENYKPSTQIPYSIKRSGGDIAESIYTLGYPRNDAVYADGYIAAKTGYNGDTLTCQISITANPGNSGSPILNHNGEVIGILSTKQNTAEGAVFAIHSKYIYEALAELQKDSSFKNLKMPSISSIKTADRVQQVKKISDFVYMVKVD